METVRVFRVILRMGLLLVVGLYALQPQGVAQATTYTVTNTNDSGPGSLRQAILDANANPGADEIQFNIPKSDPKYGIYNGGVFTIPLTSGTLLLADNSTSIDGLSERVFLGEDTNPDGWEIEVWGQTKTFPVFTLNSDFNVLLYLSITGGSAGVEISGDADWNTLNTNIIGLDGDGISKVPNNNGVNILTGSDHNSLVGNIIAGNSGFGVLISDSNNNDLDHNYIGSYTSSATIYGNAFEGVNLTGTSTSNVIGGSDSHRNVISCNGYNGVRINGAPGNTISYNHIGTNYAGNLDMGNTYNGIEITGAGDGNTISNNLISGNSQHGVKVDYYGTSDTIISNNRIGSNAASDGLIGNDMSGVALIGDYEFGGVGYNQVTENTIVGNSHQGVLIQDSDHNQVIGNHIGISPAGVSLGNAGNGILVTGGYSSGNMIGGSYSDTNYISNNGMNGIEINGASDNFIEYNQIGTDATGSIDMGNAMNGIAVVEGSPGNTISVNLISGNQSNGVYVSGEVTDDVIIEMNAIGTDSSGTSDLGNSGHGIFIDRGPDNTNILNNIISGNDQNGIYVFGDSVVGTLILDNRIGLNQPATAVLPNGWHGVAVYAEESPEPPYYLGPTSTSVQENYIGGNGWSGLVFYHSNYNAATLNQIGVSTFTSSTVLGNAFYGIHILGSHNIVAGGRIAYNGILNPAAGDGIRVEGGANDYNHFSDLSMFGNGGKGIELLSGGNNELTGPTLDLTPSCTTVSGSVPSFEAHVDLYSGPDEEGKILLATVLVDGMGHFSWSGYIPGPYVSATWTDGDNNTSEFSSFFSCARSFLPAVLRP